jgi:hypothetical protein
MQPTPPAYYREGNMVKLNEIRWRNVNEYCDRATLTDPVTGEYWRARRWDWQKVPTEVEYDLTPIDDKDYALVNERLDLDAFTFACLVAPYTQVDPCP